MWSFIEDRLRRRFIALHGIGEENQADIYRCLTCKRLLTWNHIRSGKVCCTGRVFPSEPTWFEAVKLLVLPWML